MFRAVIQKEMQLLLLLIKAIGLLFTSTIPKTGISHSRSAVMSIPSVSPLAYSACVNKIYKVTVSTLIFTLLPVDSIMTYQFYKVFFFSLLMFHHYIFSRLVLMMI